MATQGYIVLTCPLCGWRSRVPVPVNEDEEKARVAAGIGLSRLFRSQRGEGEDTAPAADLETANGLVDKVCANCKRTYLYNVRTGETRQ